MTGPLLGAGAALFALYLLARRDEPTPLGAPGSNTSVFAGASGTLYPIALGTPAPDGRRVLSVFNPQNQLLFVYSQDAAGQSRSLGPTTKEPALQPQVAVALKDFGFRK